MRLTLRRGPYEDWRKFMLAGGLLLWVYYVAVAVADADGPSWLRFVVNFVGYGLLSVGFVQRMRTRHAEQAEQKEVQRGREAETAEEDPAGGVGAEAPTSGGSDAPRV